MVYLEPIEILMASIRCWDWPLENDGGLLLMVLQTISFCLPAYFLGFILFIITRSILLFVRERVSRRTLGGVSPIGRGSIEKAPIRKPGVWVPVNFDAPVPPPYEDWDVHKTRPLPYRPFKYGPKNFITMGLRKMNFDEWIELDNEFLKFHADKASRIISRGSKACLTQPPALLAAYELLETLCTYLPARYPSVFIATSVGMENIITSESFNIIERPLKEDPMQMAARMIQDDLAIMIEGEDGQYYLNAGSILLAGFWRLEDKMGMSLNDIHMSGEVPKFKDKLEKGMNSFFQRVQPQGPVLRNNYFIQADSSLAWSSSLGPEDGELKGWSATYEKKVIADHYLRSERQSLRRLPRTGGVVFTIRTYFVPIVEIAKEPYIPGRLASAVRSWQDDVARYKGREGFQEILLEYLDREHEKQVESGLIPDGDKAYPF